MPFNQGVAAAMRSGDVHAAAQAAGVDVRPPQDAPSSPLKGFSFGQAEATKELIFNPVSGRAEKRAKRLPVTTKKCPNCQTGIGKSVQTGNVLFFRCQSCSAKFGLKSVQ